jgi:hypothetical protein
VYLCLMEYLVILPLDASIFHHLLFASIDGPSKPALRAAVVAHLLIDLRTPNYSHKFINLGIIPSVFCWIHSNLSMIGSSKYVTFAILPFFLRNIMPDEIHTALFPPSKCPTHSLLIISDRVTAATGRNCCCSPSTCLNLPIRYKVTFFCCDVPPSSNYFKIPVSTIFDISSPLNARAYPKNTKLANCATSIL